MTSRTVTSLVNEIRPDYAPQARAERLIAAGRFVLASCSLTAVWLEPSTPAQYQQATYSLLVIYTVYAAVIVGVAWRLPVPSRGWTLLSHAADLVLFSIFISLTEGPASPFFLYFIFSLFCATLRFTWRGILATGLAAMAVYGVLAFVASRSEPAFDSSRVLIRESYLGVIAALLVYLGVYQERLRAELAALAAWPRELASRIDDVLRLTLAHAATVLDAPRIILIWEESEEPWTYAAVRGDGDFRLERVAPGTYELPGAAELRNTSFFARADGSGTLVYDPAHSTVEERDGDPVGEILRKHFGFDSAMAVSLASETLTAQLLIPARAATADDLALAHIAGRLVLASLEQFFFVQQVRQTASAEERLRISRELHDGIVQSLGGVGLQLQAIRTQLLQGTPAADRLAQVQYVVEHDQRELRAIVRELRPHDTREGHMVLSEELRRMRERFPLEWGLTVEVRMPMPIEVPARLAHELCRIVNESLSNAARHGGATHATVTLHAEEDVVELNVTDNGRGFPFIGKYDLETLARNGSGPRTLRERVSALGGSLTIDSSVGGATIGARIPIEVTG